MKLRLHPKAESISQAAPLSAGEFSALMHAFAPLRGRVALAVSGGPDSMALAWCMKEWGKNPLFAFIVDHNLRPSSAAEAAQTKKALHKLGIEAEILHWEHAPVIRRLHENARRARYRLLLDACRAHGIFNLLLAHQREDQAETILMRLAKGSGVDGLAGMNMQNTKDGVRLLRPFLAISKERLLATCGTAKLPYIVDPSNQSEKFARGRLRRVMPLLAAEGLSTERLTDLGARASEVKAALDHYTDALLRVATRMDDAGALYFDLEHLRSAPVAIAERAVALCLNSIHAEEFMPERTSLRAVLKGLSADAGLPPRTLHGCLITKTKSRALFMREFSSITDAKTIRPGETVMWDGRWQVTLAQADAEHFTIRPLGNPPYAMLDRLAPGLRKYIPQGRARAGLPALWLKGELALIPALPHSPYQAAARAGVVQPNRP